MAAAADGSVFKKSISLIEKYTSNVSVTFATGVGAEITFTVGAGAQFAKPVIADNFKVWTGEGINFLISNWSQLSQYVDIVEGEHYLTQIEIGTYKVTLKFKEGAGATWTDGTTDQVELTFTITKPIEKPALENASHEYTGEEITFKIEGWDELSQYLEIVDGENVLTQTNINTYSVTIQFRSGVIASWADGTTDPVTLTFEITAKKIAKPEISEDGKEYTGSEIEFVISN